MGKAVSANAGDAAGEDGVIRNAVVVRADKAPWLDIAMNDIGVSEIPGPKNNERIMAMFAAAGHAWVTSETTAWCAAAQCAWLEEAGVPSPKTLAAREFLKWGQPVENPKPGDICVLWRGSPSGWQGHVGTFLAFSNGGSHVRLVSGNTRNSVCVADFPASRVLGFRRPRTVLKTELAGYGSAAAGIGAGAAKLATDIAAPAAAKYPELEAIQPVGDALVSTGEPTLVTIGKFMFVACVLIGAGLALYAAIQRRRDFQRRGL